MFKKIRTLCAHIISSVSASFRATLWNVHYLIVSIVGSESLEEEYYRAIATNIVQELIHRQKEHEKLEAEAQEDDAKQTRADVTSAGSQRMTSSDARRNYKEKVSITEQEMLHCVI